MILHFQELCHIWVSKIKNAYENKISGHSSYTNTLLIANLAKAGIFKNKGWLCIIIVSHTPNMKNLISKIKSYHIHKVS